MAQKQAHILPLHTAQRKDGTWDHPIEPCPLEVSTAPLSPLSEVPWNPNTFNCIVET